MNLVGVIWASLVRDLRLAKSYRLQVFLQIASLASICVTFFFASLMLQDVEHAIGALEPYNGTYLGFALVGISGSILVDVSLRSFSFSIRNAQLTGTFEAMLAGGARPATVVAGSGAYPFLSALLRSIALVIIASFIFSLELHFDAWLALVVVLGLTLVNTLALGVFSAAFIILFKKGDPLTNMIAGLSWLFSGVIYPKEILPLEIQRVADFLPLTHTLEALRRGLLAGAPADELMGSAAYLAAIACVTVPVSFLWFRSALRRAKVAGSLAQY